MIKVIPGLLVTLISTIIISCNSEPENVETIPPAVDDRFAEQLLDINEIAELIQLTDLERDYMPFFNPSGDRIYFNRLIEIINDDDDSSENNEYVEQYYSMDYTTGQIYLIPEEPSRPKFEFLPADSLPAMPMDNPAYGLRHDNTLYFAATNITNGQIYYIYQLIDDSLTQITYGKQSSLIERVSPNGRYLAFIYHRHKSILVIYDNTTGKYYAVPKAHQELKQREFSARFSPDNKYMIFMRSGELYSKNGIPYGDIWLAKFK